ncbi:hypothetical protein OAA39_00265 [bacterium]|nr:hypothetical protein [bacterium]
MIVKIKKIGLRLVTGVVTFLDTISNWAWGHLPQLTGKPYTDIIEADGTVSRLFSSSTKPEVLKWHMDDEDRVIKVLGKTNWQFQFEDQLPVSLNRPIFIKRHQWHRLIKGDGPLMISIYKHERT